MRTTKNDCPDNTGEGKPLKTKEKPSTDSEPRQKKNIKASQTKCIIMLVCAVMILLTLYFLVSVPKKYDLKVGSIAHETINATRDVVDEVTTEERRNAAANAVEPTYHFQEGVKEDVLSSLEACFNQLRTVQQYGLTLRSDGERKSGQNFTDEEIEYALGLVEGIPLSKYQITTLLRMDTAEFEDMVTIVTTAVENQLNTTIREGQITQSIQTILQIVGYKLDISVTQNILPTILRICIKPNMTIDQETTDQARENAKEAVEPIVYLQGENIIRSGERITVNQIEMLRTLGLLKDNSYDYSVYAGSVIAVLLSIASLIMLLLLLLHDVFSDPRRMAVILIILLLCSGFSVVSHMLPSIYILPVTLGPILITVLLGYRAGLALTIPLAFIVSSLSSGSSVSSFYDVLLLMAITMNGGIAVIWFLKGHPQRIRILLSGVLSAFVSVATIIAIRFLTSVESINNADIILWTIAGNLLSGFLAIAFQPAFEAVFRLATPSKLLEITNPNQPLMKRLMIEAPGTYHHSIVVANLAEAAAQKIGANPYLARAGGYYHDIGKLKRPMYFKENQLGENPHEKTDPYVSAAILTNHTKDGELLAQKDRLPPEVQDIILQHHGVTPVMYFYHKALQLSNGNQIDINDFRYQGPKPQTKEAAIVMLADTIEAAVRSMKDPTPKAIDQFIERLIRGKLEDGQLSDCPLTLKDIDSICEAFSGILRGVYHERIEYPNPVRTLTSKPAAAAPSAPEQQSASAAEKQAGATSAPEQQATTATEKPAGTCFAQEQKAVSAADKPSAAQVKRVESDEPHVLSQTQAQEKAPCSLTDHDDNSKGESTRATESDEKQSPN